MSVVITHGGAWFRQGKIVIDTKHCVIARGGETASFPRKLFRRSGAVPKGFQIAMMVLGAYPHAVSCHAIIQMIWGAENSGGPEWVNHRIKVMISKANRVMRHLGIAFRGTYQTGGGYRAEIAPEVAP